MEQSAYRDFEDSPSRRKHKRKIGIKNDRFKRFDKDGFVNSNYDKVYLNIGIVVFFLIAIVFFIVLIMAFWDCFSLERTY